MDERGAVAILVALSMVILLGAIAMSIDVGRIYQERRELQNGADAAAHAVAYDCASGDCGASNTTANLYADGNASDGRAAVGPVVVDHVAQKVTVSTMTETSGNGNILPMTFARLVGFDGVTVKARSTVAWGGLQEGAAAPILLRTSLWNQVNPSRLVTLKQATSGTVPPGSLLTIAHRSERTGLADPSIARFEWLEGSANCSLDVEAGGWVQHRDSFPPDPAPPPDCSGSGLADIVNQVSLVVFYEYHPFATGNTKQVAGLGAMFVTSVDDCGMTLLGFPSTCITGYLISDYVVDGPIGGDAFGVNAIQFVSE